MNSWERVVKAFELDIPDVIPLYEMHVPPIILSHILNKPLEKIFLFNSPTILSTFMKKKNVDIEKINDKIVEEILLVQKKLGLDWIRVIGAVTHIPSDIEKIDDVWIINGHKYLWTGYSMWWMNEPVKYDPDEVLKKYRDMDIDIDSSIFYILEKLVKKVKGKVFLSFDADGTWGPIVSYPNFLKHVLIWMYKRPDVVKTIIDYYTRTAIEIGKWAIDIGVDAIQLCVDYGNLNGPWMSPKMFRKFIKPALKRHCDIFHKKGAYVVMHSDGNITPLLKDIVDAGIDGYQGIDIIAGMSLKWVKENFGDKICLIGNADPRIIEFGDKKDVEREVERCIREGARNGGYIFSTSANISANTNTENFLHMIKYFHMKRRNIDRNL